MTLMRASRPSCEPARRGSGMPLPLYGSGGRTFADLGGRLADHLLVDALDDDLRRQQGTSNAMPLARLDDDGMRVADRKLEVGSLELRAVADALDLEVLLEALASRLRPCSRSACASDPWSARSSPRSVGRVTTISVSVFSICIRAGTSCESSPERPVHLNAPRRDRHHDAGG